MNNKDILVTPANIQGELIRNEIELNDLQFQAFKEQKYNELLKENQQLKEKINTYEDPEDLTLMFMYCNEKAKDKIKELKEENEELKFIVGLRQKRNLIRKFDKEYDAEDKEKNPNRIYAGITPDAEVVYQRYYKQKEVIDEVRRYIDVHKKWVKNDDEMVEPILDGYNIRDLLQILDKVKEN